MYQGKLELKSVMQWKTKIAQVKTLPAGRTIGYGLTYMTYVPTKIAVIPVGYADGLNRKLGNGNGNLLIRNKRVPIIGNVCMDMCMVDLTGTDAEAGDEAEIFGENIHIDELAEKCGTIPYEILTSIPSRVKRVFFRE